MKILIPILASLGLGAYAGFMHAGLVGVLFGALWIGGVALWGNRDLLKLSHEETSGVGASYDFFSRLGALTIYLALAAISAALQALTYFPVAWLHR